jgi:hypothetical protein
MILHFVMQLQPSHLPWRCLAWPQIAHYIPYCVIAERLHMHVCVCTCVHVCVCVCV